MRLTPRTRRRFWLIVHITAFVCGVLLAEAACGTAGPAQAPVDRKPLVFVDAQSKRPVEPVLVIPKYSSTTGVSTGGGHGDGHTFSERAWLAAPTVYWGGTPFEPPQPDSGGLLVGPLLFVGRGIALDGVLVLSTSHEPLWVHRLWGRAPDTVFELMPAQDQDAIRRHWIALLDAEVIHVRDLSTDERDMLSLSTVEDLRLQFSADDRRQIRGFFER